MDFEIDQVIDGPLPAVEKVLFDPEFVAATSALPRLSDCALLGRHDDNGIINVQIHRRFGADLNAAVRRVVKPERLTWVEHVEYDPTKHRGKHVIDPDHYADRIRCSYVTTLSSGRGDITDRRTQGTMSVKAAFVAGKVEHAIVDGLREYAKAEAELLGEWARRADD